MRHICGVTGARADFSYLLPVFRQIANDRDMKLSVVATGTHLSREFGSTIAEVRASGIESVEEVPLSMADDTPLAIANSIAEAVSGLARAYDRIRPDVLLLLGDRTETFAAAAAMVPFATPIAHIAGGEATLGAIDDVMRHAITKMSHLHFVATERSRDRVVQMGEDPSRVTVTGAPSLDNLREIKLLTAHELSESLNISMVPAPLLVTFHPATLEFQDAQLQIDALLSALETLQMPVVFTYPNADTNSGTIIAAIDRYVAAHGNSRFFTSLGMLRYFSLMKHAAAMVGNSSSGIIEAASLELPVVNIGTRQGGRDHGVNVIDVECERSSIADALWRAISAEFRRGLSGMRNPYGDGRAAERIVSRLRTVTLGRSLLMKKFFDLPAAVHEAVH
jgi:UDP-hydrolysing UDP-N-acetyl-D-glucosamine 2-epimerase